MSDVLLTPEQQQMIADARAAIATREAEQKRAMDRLEEARTPAERLALIDPARRAHEAVERAMRDLFDAFNQIADDMERRPGANKSEIAALRATVMIQPDRTVPEKLDELEATLHRVVQKLTKGKA